VSKNDLFLYAAIAIVVFFKVFMVIVSKVPHQHPENDSHDDHWSKAAARSVNERRKENLSPPRASISVLEERRNLSNGNAPWYFERMAEETRSDIYQFASKKKTYIVGDSDTAREILTDKLTTKSTNAVEFFKPLFGPHIMGSRPNNDTIWRNARKAVNRSFSSSEVKRMNEIALRHIQKWITEILEPTIEKDEAIDPSYEMSRITFKVILEATMEYNGTDEEYESFAHHLGTGIRDVAVGNVFFPMRKYYGLLGSKYRNGLKSCAEVKAFGRKVLRSYHENPNKSSYKTVIQVLDTPGVCIDEDHKIGQIASMIFGEKLFFKSLQNYSYFLDSNLRVPFIYSLVL